MEAILIKLNAMETSMTLFSKAQKALEQQFFNKANEAQRDPGKLPARTESNPKGQIIAITTRSGLKTADPVPRSVPVQTKTTSVQVQSKNTSAEMPTEVEP